MSWEPPSVEEATNRLYEINATNKLMERMVKKDFNYAMLESRKTNDTSVYLTSIEPFINEVIKDLGEDTPEAKYLNNIKDNYDQLKIIEASAFSKQSTNIVDQAKNYIERLTNKSIDNDVDLMQAVDNLAKNTDNLCKSLKPDNFSSACSLNVDTVVKGVWNKIKKKQSQDQKKQSQDQNIDNDNDNKQEDAGAAIAKLLKILTQKNNITTQNQNTVQTTSNVGNVTSHVTNVVSTVSNVGATLSTATNAGSVATQVSAATMGTLATGGAVTATVPLGWPVALIVIGIILAALGTIITIIGCILGAYLIIRRNPQAIGLNKAYLIAHGATLNWFYIGYYLLKRLWDKKK